MQKIKKFLLIGLSIIGATTMFMGCNAQIDAESLHFQKIAGKEEYRVVNIGTVSETEIVIPSTYKGLPVTEIGYQAFSSGVNGATAYVTSIKLPNSITSIGNSAFSGCESLTHITIPDGVISIGDSTFSGCKSLTSVEIPDNVTTIGNSAFSGCEKLTSIEIPDSVESIGGSAFYQCTGLTSIEIPDSVESIDYATFFGCSGFTSVVIGGSVTSIGAQAFASCDNLTSVVIPDSVTSIGYSAFNSCSSLTSIEIPDGVTSIEFSVFSGCERLIIYCELESAHPYWTYDWNRFDRDEACPVVWDCNNNEVADDGYIYCVIEGVRYGINDNDDFAVVAKQAKAMQTAVISTSITYKGESFPVTNIGSSAFAGCSSLTSIVIPDSVISIGSSAFSGCDSLQYNEKDNLQYLGNSNNPHLYLSGVTSTDIATAHIDANCKFIGPAVFAGCSSLTSIEIPNSVIGIGKSAFYWCGNLISVVIPDSVTSIGERAFERCYSLTTIYCEAEREPAGWESGWNKMDLVHIPVVWGYTGE